MDWSVVICESGPSRHGWTYPPDVLKAAVPLFHGKPVRAHPYRIVHGKVEYQHLPESEAAMAPYLVREMIGTLEQPWWHDGGILARLRLLPSCELSDDVLHTYGLSMQVGATVHKDAQGVPVEVRQLTEAISVDLVETPAARGCILGPWTGRAEAERWHNAERAMVRFEESCQATVDAQRRQAFLRGYEQRLDAVVRRYESRMEALYAR